MDSPGRRPQVTVPLLAVEGAPVGLTMSSSGTLSGTPKPADALQTYTVTVKAKSAGAPPVATATFTITLTS